MTLADAATSARPVRRGWTLSHRLSMTFVVLAVLVIAGTVLGTVSLARLNSAQQRQVDQLDPAIQTNTDLFISLVNQETGLRGYALTRDPSFLAPYEQGRAQTDVTLRTLRQQVGHDRRLMADVSALEAGARRWQSTYAEPAVRTIRATPAGQLPNVEFDRGKGMFDVIRADYQQLGDDFDAARTSARDQLSTSTIWLVVLVIGAIALAAASGIMLWIALRRWIVGPLSALRREVRVVADGDLEHVVSITGPPDIVEVADDAELMRQRMLSEYQSAVQAQRRALEAAEQVEQQAAELLRSNVELEQFAYVASHDLQEPLRKVASFCQMLERRYSGQLDERGEQYIRFAVDGAKRMQNLINDLLAFSRVGRTTAAFRPVDLRDCVDAALGDLAARLAEVQGQVDVVGPLPTVSGDPGLLRQLFLNLVGNALKFRADEPPHVRISAERSAAVWAVTVSDNGIGIDPRYAQKVFAIFARLHPREEYEGTGIGLALCRKIVEFHGGTIDVVHQAGTSPDGRGATLRFTLPVMAAPAGAARAADSSSATTPRASDSHRTLAADTAPVRTGDA